MENQSGGHGFRPDQSVCNGDGSSKRWICHHHHSTAYGSRIQRFKDLSKTARCAFDIRSILTDQSPSTLVVRDGRAYRLDTNSEITACSHWPLWTRLDCRG